MDQRNGEDGQRKYENSKFGIQHYEDSVLGRFGNF